MFKSLLSTFILMTALIPTFAFSYSAPDAQLEPLIYKEQLKKQLILDSDSLSLLEVTGLTSAKEFLAVEFKASDDEQVSLKSETTASIQFDLAGGHLRSLTVNNKTFKEFKIKSMSKDSLKLFATLRNSKDKLETIFVTVKLKEVNLSRKAKITVENVTESDLYTGIAGELELGSKISGI